MGTWAVDAFGNDTACDWVYGLEEAEDLSVVDAALEAVIANGNAYLDSSLAEEALVAIEVIARLQGNWGERTSYSEGVDDWVEKTKLPPSDDLAQKALQVIDRIVAEDSEMKELWEDSEEYAAWVAAIEELRERIRT